MIDLTQIAGKWQKRWQEEGIFKTREDPKKKKYYVLEMYPYPSASFLHMGHVRNYTIGDVYARFRRMNGYNVLYPMGYDSFGLPAETAAKKEGIHPQIYTDRSIEKIMEYQKALGNSYDWDRVIASHDIDYYKWNQYFFNKMFERGLVYRKKAPVNWCENCQSTLANEEAESGKCWRCDSEVVKKDLEQWFFRITAYADRLLEDLPKIDWPEKIKVMQTNWIGKSYGTEIQFTINGEVWPVFTTRPDTIFGVTFMVISAQHPRLMELVTKEQKNEVVEFVKRCQKVRTPEEVESLEKEGAFTGSYAVNPANGEKVPVYAGNFVLADYGCGMVMAVPAHDQRDFEFAKKFNLEIRDVIRPVYGTPAEKEEFRKTISVVLQRKKDGKFLMLHWKQFDWTSPVIGGIENGETPAQAAEREILEETGYKARFVRNLGGEIESHFYAENKSVWRHRIDQPVLMEIIDETPQKTDDTEKNRHSPLWLTAEEVLKKTTHEEKKIWLLRYLGQDKAYTSYGVLMNSGEFDGLTSEEAIDRITKSLGKKGLGKRVVNYKIRDWMISRQRYWGTPIPMIHCPKCGIVPVPDKDLPVLLPKEVDFSSPGNPLSSNKEFVNTTCPKCGGPAKRDTDTMGGFMDSSWYFLRYCDNKSKDKPFDPAKVKYWMPVDQYIGGAEHAVMHLLYARFFIKALKDMGIVDFDEPFAKLFNQGIVYKDGAKMSKSKGNVVYQTDISDKYGIDTARFFLMFVSAPDKLFEWTDAGIEGSYRALNKVIAISEKPLCDKMDKLTMSKMHRTIREMTEDIESFQYNKGLITLMEFVNHLYEMDSVPKEALKNLVLMLSPFTPHLSEEIWANIGGKGFISLESWPSFDSSKIDEKAEAVEATIERTVSDIRKVLELTKIASPKKITLIVSQPWKYPFYRALKSELESTRDLKSVMTKLMADKSFSQHGSEVSKIVPSALKDSSKLPSVITSVEEEFDGLSAVKAKLTEKFGAEINVERAESFKNPKSAQAIPGKPAILVE